MLKPENTNLNIYDFFEGEVVNSTAHRGVIVITSKQMLFYGQLEKPDENQKLETHWGIVNSLHRQIEPGVDKSYSLGEYDSDVHILTTGNFITIDLPNNGQLSKMQAYFLLDILDQFEKINAKVTDENKKLNIDFCSPNYRVSKIDSHDIKAMKNAVLKSITPNFVIHEERIVGKTLPDKKVLDSLKYHLSSSKFFNKSDASRLNTRFNSCYHDRYFSKYIQVLFPRYNEDISMGAIGSRK